MSRTDTGDGGERSVYHLIILPVSGLKRRMSGDSFLIIRGPNRVPVRLLQPTSKGTPTKQASKPEI